MSTEVGMRKSPDVVLRGPVFYTDSMQTPGSLKYFRANKSAFVVAMVDHLLLLYLQRYRNSRTEAIRCSRMFINRQDVLDI